MDVLKVLIVDDKSYTGYGNKKNKIRTLLIEQGMNVQADYVPWEDYFLTMFKAFRGEIDYDVIMIAGYLWLQDLVSKGYLEPLNYDFEDILPIVAQEMTCEGKTYLSPCYCDGHMIVYRKSILKEVLGQLPGDIWSTAIYTQVSIKLREAGYRSTIALKPHSAEILLEALPHFESDRQRQTEGIKEQALKAIHNADNNKIKEDFAKEQIVMATTWFGQMRGILEACPQPDDIGFAGFQRIWNVTWGYGINSKSKKKKEAKAFLDYLRSKEIDRLSGVCSGAPIRKSTYLEEANKYPWYKIQLYMLEKCAQDFIPRSYYIGNQQNQVYSSTYRNFVYQISIEESIRRERENKES